MFVVSEVSKDEKVILVVPNAPGQVFPLAPLAPPKILIDVMRARTSVGNRITPQFVA